MTLLLALVACLPHATEGTPDTDTGAERDDTAPDTDDTPGTDTAAEALAADDARVRALTGLPEGDNACAAPVLVRIVEVLDGDTVHAVPDGESRYESVRLIGVDTPEIAHDAGEVADCYGDEASDFSHEELEGRLAWLTFDTDCLDPYDRTLAYLFRDDTDDGFFNRRLLREGWATQLTVYPNDTYEDVFAEDERAARTAGAGLWSACNR